MDLKNTDNDLDITDGDLSWVNEIDAVAQDLSMSLKTWLQETPYDRNAGVPWEQVVFVRGITANALRAVLEATITSVDGVTDVIQLEPEINFTTREATVTGRVRALDQEFPIAVSTGELP